MRRGCRWSGNGQIVADRLANAVIGVAPRQGGRPGRGYCRSVGSSYHQPEVSAHFTAFIVTGDREWGGARYRARALQKSGRAVERDAGRQGPRRDHAGHAHSLGTHLHARDPVVAGKHGRKQLGADSARRIAGEAVFIGGEHRGGVLHRTQRQDRYSGGDTAPGDDASVRFHGGETVCPAEDLGVASIRRRTTTALRGAAPRTDGAIRLERGEGIVGAENLGVAGARRRAAASAGCGTPRYDRPIRFQRGEGTAGGKDPLEPGARRGVGHPTPRHQRTIGPQRGKGIRRGPDFREIRPARAATATRSCVSPDGDAAIFIPRRVGTVAGIDLGVAGARRRPAAAFSSSPPGRDAAIGLQCGIGIPVRDNAVETGRGGRARAQIGGISPDGDAAIRLQRGKTVGAGENLRVAGAGRGARTASGGRAPRSNASIGLQRGKRLPGRGDLLVAGGHGRAAAAIRGIAPRRDGAVPLQRGKRPLVRCDLGIAGIRGRAAAAGGGIAPDGDYSMHSQTGKGIGVGELHTRTDGVGRPRALPLVHQPVALHPESEGLADVVDGVGHRKFVNPRLCRRAVDPAADRIQREAGREGSAAQREAQTIPPDTRIDLGNLALDRHQAGHRIRCRREVGQRLDGRLHGQIALVRRSPGAPGGRRTPRENSPIVLQSGEG